MYKKKITQNLLERYLHGSCSPDEKKLVEEWYVQLDRHFDSNQQQVPSFDRAVVFDQIRHELGLVEMEGGKEKTRLTKIIKYSLSAAAVLAVIAIAGYSFFFSRDGILKPGNNSSANLMGAKVFKNESSAVTKDILPDGSTVWLNPGAELKYSQPAGSANREIDFSGEAFFDVHRDVKHPFVIHSGLMTTTVLGTSFNVMAIPNSKKFKVSVVSGSVRVSVIDTKYLLRAVLLKPNEQASFLVNSGELTYAAISATELKENYWRPVTLNFEDAEMGEIAAELEKVYKVKVVFGKQSISKCKLKVDFDNQKLPQILNFIEKLLDVKCKLNDQNVLSISGEGCS